MEANGMYWEGLLLEVEGVQFSSWTCRVGDFLLGELMRTCAECRKGWAVNAEVRTAQKSIMAPSVPLVWPTWLMVSIYHCWPGPEELTNKAVCLEFWRAAR